MIDFATVTIRRIPDHAGMSVPILEASLHFQKHFGFAVANGYARIASEVVWERDRQGYAVLIRAKLANITWRRVTIAIETKPGKDAARHKRSVSPRRLYVTSSKNTAEWDVTESEVLTALMRRGNPTTGEPLLNAGEYAEIVDGQILTRKLH